MNKKLKSFLMTMLRAVVGYGVAFYFLQKLFDKDQFLAEVRGGNITLFGVALMAFGCALLISFLRWRRLMAVVGVNLDFLTVIRLGMIGMFFNSSLPGAVSGDIVKMIYIRHHAPDKRTEAILTIMLDRIFGVFGLLAVAIAACLLNLNYLIKAESQIKLWILGVGVSSFAGIAIILALMFKDTLIKLPGGPKCVELGTRILPEKILGILERIIKAMDLYRNNHGAVAYAIFLSMINHLLMALILMCVSYGIHTENVPASRYVLASSMSNAVSAVPITPGSFGIRDTVNKIFLEQAGAAVEKAKVAPILVTCVIAFWSLVGGVFYVIGKTGAGKEDLTPDDDPDEELAL